MIFLDFNGTRDETEGQFYLQITDKPYGQPHVNRFGYWCDRSHVEACIRELELKLGRAKQQPTPRGIAKTVQTDLYFVDRQGNRHLGRTVTEHYDETGQLIQRKTEIKNSPRELTKEKTEGQG